LITDEHSFDWVWESNFVEWLKCDAKVFWIAGKPASGKSTLVNYIKDHHRTRGIAEEALGDDLIIANFFLDFRAKSGIGNNFEGLRRSLLYQLLTTSSALAADVMQRFGIKQLDEKIMLADATILEYALKRTDRPTLLFVDGLDEYEGNKPELLSLVDKITENNVKVCLSSRYERPFTETFKDLSFQFRMETLNKPGIYAYATHILQTTLRPSSNKERLALVFASRDIASSSAGVFLWARFAVSEVVDRICEGRQINYEWIRTIIHSIPPELEDVYARMFQVMKDKDQKACGIILALINSAATSLVLSQIFEAALLAGNDFRSLDDNITPKDLADFKRYLETVGAGLIHCSVPDDIDYYFYRDDCDCSYCDDEHEDDEYGEEEDGDDDDDNDDDDDDVAEAYQYQPGIHVTMMHRSVQTYLDSKGWKRLFGEQRVPASHHELWLDICHDVLVGRRVRWVVPAGLYDNTCSESLQPMDQKQLEDCDVGLNRYAYVFLPYHAYHYEQETAKSSSSLIHNVLSPRFVREHCRLNCDWRPGRGSCSDCSWLKWRGSHITGLCDDVQLAVSHCLSPYVKEALRYHPEAFKSGSFVSALDVTYPILEIPGDEFLSPGRRPECVEPSGEMSVSPLDDPRANPLGTAVLWGCYRPSPERSKLVLLLAPHSSRLKDVEMLMAIRTLSIVEIEALLVDFPPFPLHLCSSLLDQRPHAAEILFTNPERVIANGTYGPLWEVGRRYDIRSTTELLRFFLERGEEINAQCGPKGTILHSVAENCLVSTALAWPDGQIEAVFNILTAHGADINATGPEGNVLEYVWREAHVTTHRLTIVTHLEDYRRTRVKSFSSLVRSLIKMGATNSVCDPNGLVPSKARMLAVANAHHPSVEDIDYYFHGTCSDPHTQAYRRELDGLSLISSEQLDCPSRRSTESRTSSLFVEDS